MQQLLSLANEQQCVLSVSLSVMTRIRNTVAAALLWQRFRARQGLMSAPTLKIAGVTIRQEYQL